MQNVMTIAIVKVDMILYSFVMVSFLRPHWIDSKAAAKVVFLPSFPKVIPVFLSLYLLYLMIRFGAVYDKASACGGILMVCSAHGFLSQNQWSKNQIIMFGVRKRWYICN